MSVSPEKIAAIVLFSIPWMMAVYELYRGWTKGFMKEYLRSSYSEINDFDKKPDRFCYRKDQPKTFWCLFLFYTVIAILVPLGIGYAITHPPEEPKINPSSGSHKETSTYSLEV